MKKNNMIQDLHDFRKKLRVDMQSQDTLKTPSTNRTKILISPIHINNNMKQSSSFRDRINLQSNKVPINGRSTQHTNHTALKCITHTGLESQHFQRFASQEDVACATPKGGRGKKSNLTDRLLSYTQLVNFHNSLSDLDDLDLSELPKEYIQQLDKVAQVIQYKLHVQ